MQLAACAALAAGALVHGAAVPDDVERAYLGAQCQQRVAAECAPVDCLGSLRTRVAVHALDERRFRIVTEARWGFDRYEHDVTCADPLDDPQTP